MAMTRKPRTSSTTATPKRRSPNVPLSYLGFSFQATRFLLHLLKADRGDVVCLEVFEDVGVEKADGTKIAEQDKASVVSNPLSNRSEAFWKTIHNWIDAVQTGVLPLDKTSFVICAPRGKLGTIAESFHNARTAAEALAAIAAARQTLCLSRDAASPSGSDDGAVASHLAAIFSCSKELFAMVVAHITIETTGEDHSDKLKELFLSKLVSQEAYDDVVRWAHGWVKTRLDSLIELRQPARVPHDEFHDALLNYVRAHDRLEILRSFAGTPDEAEVVAEMAFRDYVRQLRLIEMDDVDILAAVNDYLQAASDRVAWSERGLIDESSLDRLANELLTTWRNKKRRVTLGHSDKPDRDQGQLLYLDCIEHKGRLDTFDTPEHFVRGSWHALADDRSIGWHPHYETKLDSVALRAD